MHNFSPRLPVKNRGGSGARLGGQKARLYSPSSDKIVILSGAPHRFVERHSACGAESKDLGDAHLVAAAGSFSTIKPENRTLRYALEWSGVLLCILDSRERHWRPVVEKLRTAWVN